MKFYEIVLAIGLFAGAVYYLYRKFTVSKGCMCGNSGACSQHQKGIHAISEKDAASCSCCSERDKS
jgi:hypothetical protein